MKNRATQPVADEDVEEKSFLHRHAPAIAIIVFLTIVLAAIVGTVLVLRRNAAYTPPPPVALSDLPGPKDQISERSKYQIVTLSKENPHVVSAVVVRYHFNKGESPFLFAWGHNPQVQKMMNDIVQDVQKRRATPRPNTQDSSLKESKDTTEATRALRQSEEAKLGLIKCVPIEDLVVTYPQLKTIATGICYATIPPFEADARMAIIMLTDTPLASYTELAEMRRTMLSLQIDIYNREFQGRETWAHL